MRKPAPDFSSAPRSAALMTFREVSQQRYACWDSGTCRFCGAFAFPLHRYAVRSKVCGACCLERGDQKLPAVAARERRCWREAARMLANPAGYPDPARFLSILLGVTRDFSEWCVAQQREAHANA